ncbi:MAG: imelysin family protein [Thermodesulfobacteriota bacterium]
MFSKKIVLTVTFLLLSSFGLIGGCGGSSSDSGGGNGGGDNSAFIQQIINNYVDNIVVETYDILSTRATALRQAVETLEGNRTQQNLTAAQQAWISSRVPWEQSESWLFGPVDFSGFDPALDSWPVNRTDLDAVLDSGNDLTEGFIANLDPTLKGFHTAEYILFDFAIEELGDREYEYLVAVVRDIETTAQDLVDSWIVGNPPFGDLMKGAGNNNVFPSQQSALEQIIEGMSIILDEVANGKIADPFDNQDVEAVESQFSFNSRADFADDIRGVQNVYLGNNSLTGLNGPGLNDLVAQTNPALATQMEQEIQTAINAILAIPQPFRDAILDPNAADEIEAAQDAINTAFNTLNAGVLNEIRQ